MTLPLFSPDFWIALIGGTIWGVLLGLLPGITGIMALIMAIPIAINMEPVNGLAMLVAIHAVADIGGAITAIAMGLPGTPSNVATVDDGHALTRLGHMRRAISASAFASAAGGMLGFFLLVATLPIALALVKQVGAAEIFAICCLGMLSVARLGSANVWKGLFAASLGVFLGLAGMKHATGEPRLWFGMQPMLDGLHILAVTTGLFGGPELIRLVIGPVSQVAMTGAEKAPVFQGCRDVLSRPIILFKSALIGWLVGIMPGVGGSASSLLAHAWSGASRGHRDVETHIDGVVAAESSNNAKEGGDLVPALTLGLPASAGMSVLIGVFIMYGLTPGPQLIANHPDIVVSIALALLMSNLLGGLFVAFGSRPLVHLLSMPNSVLAPFAITCAIMGVLSVRGEMFDLVSSGIFCVLGILMLRHGFSRPALIMGFVLAPIIETYGSIAWSAYGWNMAFRPGIIVILIISVLLSLLGKSR